MLKGTATIPLYKTGGGRDDDDNGGESSRGDSFGFRLRPEIDRHETPASWVVVIVTILTTTRRRRATLRLPEIRKFLSAIYGPNERIHFFPILREEWVAMHTDDPSYPESLHGHALVYRRQSVQSPERQTRLVAEIVEFVVELQRRCRRKRVGNKRPTVLPSAGGNRHLESC